MANAATPIKSAAKGISVDARPFDWEDPFFLDDQLTEDEIARSGAISLGDALKGASVTAKVVGHGRADKVRIIKFRRRKHHMKRQGHRQHYTEIEITGINK